jgi:hypothetical protein
MCFWFKRIAMKNKWSNIRADALFDKHFLPKKLAHFENNVYFEYL